MPYSIQFKNQTILFLSSFGIKKGDKINRTEMIADYQCGGQKVLDIIEFNKALKISWILKYISNEFKSKCFFFIFIYLK